MASLNLLSRRSFLDRTTKAGLLAAFSALVDIPLVMKKALAEGMIGKNGKKLLFIWLRGANDGLNSVIPIQDSAYGPGIRPTLYIPKDPAEDYSRIGPARFPINAASTDPTYGYQFGIPLGNGFCALHPVLKFLAPVYNAGELALVHRVAYPLQSRSHFDSQNYWENGMPRNDVTKNGIFYRAMLESGLANTEPLTGVSVQSSLPLILRGSEAAMTNLSDPLRYDLLGVPNNANGSSKAQSAILRANGYPFVEKQNRDLLKLQYDNLVNTLDIFAGIGFDEADNTFQDNEITDNDTEWADANGGMGYYLFPTTQDKNGGWRRPDASTTASKYVIPPSGQSFMQRLKAAALILEHTDAIIAGTEFGGFDTHSAEGRFTGQHPNLNQQIGWAIYALRKFFTYHTQNVSWEDVVVVTLTEFGRTTIENSDLGTDHAEAGVMFVAGGAIQGYGKGNDSGVFMGHPDDSVPWISGPADQGGGVDGSMFGVSNRYLKRAVDYRSVLGEIIRKHLGSTQPQLERILPGYADGNENLLDGGMGSDGTEIAGEVGLL